MTVPSVAGASAADPSVPGWLARLVDAAPTIGGDNSRNRSTLEKIVAPTIRRPRSAAVLLHFTGSFTDGPELPDDARILLTRRADSLRQHRGQVAFPGGSTDPEDNGPVATALREAEEETGLNPASVQVLGSLGTFFVPPSGFIVTPVLAYSSDEPAVRVVDTGETAAVSRVPLADLIDPARRITVRRSALYKGPAFTMDDLFVWGFTAGILTEVIAAAGWEKPWNRHDTRELSEYLDNDPVTDPVVEP